MARQHHRHNIQNAMVYISRESANGEKHCAYRINNFSRGGLQFSSSDDYQVDEQIKIKVDFGNGDSHIARARICYCLKNPDPSHSFEYGVSYLDNYF